MIAPLAKPLVALLFACGALLPLRNVGAQSGMPSDTQPDARPGAFSFAVITRGWHADETALRQAINDTDAEHLAFVVANGMKTSAEPCSDTLYLRRKALFDAAHNGLVLALAGSDWAECRNSHGKSTAIERLSRVRELFFADEFSLGEGRLPLMRESAAAKFRAYAENTRWEAGNILFATINLPANNNRYRMEAGRNGEFEDRSIANHDWLRRLFAVARHQKNEGIVLFCDGNPLLEPGVQEHSDLGIKRDGFTETRRLLRELTGKFPGRVLVVHNAAESKSATHRHRPAGIAWRDNLGNLEIASGWRRIVVMPATPTLFSIDNESDSGD